MRDSRPIKRSLLSRLSIRNHLSPATSFAQWLMGLHRPWVPAHYLVHTAPLFKHKGRNMKHCFRRCLWVKKKSIYCWPGEESLLTIFGHVDTREDAGRDISLNEPDESNPFKEKNHRFKSNELRVKDWMFLKHNFLVQAIFSKVLIKWSHIWIRKGPR